MKSEVIIAIIIGFAIGLVITFGIYQAQKLYLNPSKDKATEEANLIKPTPETNPKDTQFIEIDSPANFSLSTVDTITVTGQTSPEAFVTIVSETLDVIGQADDDGNFEIEIELESGANLLTLTSVNENGNQISKDLTVTYIVTEDEPNQQATEEISNEE